MNKISQFHTEMLIIEKQERLLPPKKKPNWKAQYGKPKCHTLQQKQNKCYHKKTK